MRMGEVGVGRKHLLDGLGDDELTAVNESSEGEVGSKPTPRPTFGSRGAVGAMGRSLERISAEMDAAKALEAQMAGGHVAVEIDPALVDPSFIPDRMEGADEDHASLVDAIRERGQLVPILVRPHSKAPGRYEIAFGHRRLRAAMALGRPIRAVIRQLSDEELVVAQGQENNARKNLSYIERASFAARLEDRGFTRDTIMASLSVDKTELSRLISIRRAFPVELVAAIGPAPKTGRRRWMDLVDRLQNRNSDELVERLIADFANRIGSSDERFNFFFEALASKSPTAGTPGNWATEEGRKIAHIARGPNRVILTLDEKTTPDFGGYLVDRLPELYRAFQQQRQRKQAR